MTKLKPKPNTRGPWLKDPRRSREGETIGGGYFVFRRGDGTNRIRPAQWPFEYATIEEASGQALTLSEANPGLTFIVVGQQASFTTVASATVAEAA